MPRMRNAQSHLLLRNLVRVTSSAPGGKDKISSREMKRLGEIELIERIRAGSGSGTGARNASVRVGIGDDCAVLRVPAGCELVVTTDLLLEGRHFCLDWHTAESAGHRCLARGLSDVAAMGAWPLAAFLSLGLPAGFDMAWLDEFMAGFGALAERFGVELAGGDTAQTAGAEIVADVVVTGAVETGRGLLRSGARVGDGIFVTGELGGSAVELAGMAEGSRRERGRQSFPEPRVEVGLELVRLGIATSCMDLSDGISLDLARLCEASGCGAEIAAASLPLAKGATLEQGLDGGEDYELLFTAGAGSVVPEDVAGVGVRRIGTIVGGEGVMIVDAGGGLVPLRRGGWEHFGD